MQGTQLNKAIYFLVAMALYVTSYYFTIGFHWDYLPFGITNEDFFPTIWGTQVLAHNIASGQPWDYTQSMLYPQGLDLKMHAYSRIYGFVNYFVHSPIPAINIGLFVNFILLTTGTFTLTFWYSKQFVIGLSVGLFAAFNGYILSKTGLHLNLVLIGLVPWCLLLYLFSWQAKRPLKFVYFGVFTLLTACNWFFDHYAILYVLSFVALHILYCWGKTMVLRLGAKKSLLFGGLAILGLHFLSQYFYKIGWDKKGAIWETADVRQLVYHLTNSLNYHKGNPPNWGINTEHFLFLGLSLLLIFVVALLVFTMRKDSRLNGTHFLLFLIVSYLLICLPGFRIGDMRYFFSPFTFMHYLPGIDNVRSPSRFVALVFPAMALFSWVVLWPSLLQRGRLWVVLVLAAMSGLFVWEMQVSYSGDIGKADVNLSPEENKLIKVKVLLTIPFGVRDGLQQFGIFNPKDYSYAMAGAKVFSGYISRIDAANWDRVKSDSLLQYAVSLNDAKTIDSFQVTALLQQCKTRKVDILAVQQIIGGEVLNKTMLAMSLKPLLQEGDVWYWAIK
jgi:hypothetical protein